MDHNAHEELIGQKCITINVLTFDQHQSIFDFQISFIFRITIDQLIGRPINSALTLVLPAVEMVYISTCNSGL